MTTHPLPSLDVVIPCYDEASELGPCIELLLAQSDHLKTIIIVDNNSHDDSYDIALQYSRRHPIIEVLREKKQGTQYARNTGIAHARADIVARIDVDTRVQPNWAHNIRTYYMEHIEVSAATGASEYYDLPFRRFTNTLTWFFMSVSNEVTARTVSLYGANMSVRRSAWEAIISNIRMDSGIMEDLAISLALQKQGYKIAYIKEAFAYVSGRRIRTDPRQFVRYNRQWWMTYRAYDENGKAAAIRVMSWFGDALQAFAAVGLRFHDPATDTFRLRHFRKAYAERSLP